MVSDRYRLALLLVIASGLANSLNGLIVRSMDSAHEWQIVFWRSLFLGASLCIVFAVQHGWRAGAAVRELRPWALVGSVAIATVNTCFILALSHTTVANAMFTLSAAPFLTALLGWLVLREKVERGVWVGMAVALAGVGVMLWDGLGAGTLLGNAYAMLAAFSFASFVVVLRWGRTANMLPVVIIGIFLGTLNAGFMSGWELTISLHDAGLLFVWGAVISGAVHAIFTWSSRHVPGAELTLLILIEFVLAPVWVWLAIDEKPSTATLIGGALVIASVASRAFASFRKEARTR